jgi:Right handed beta helix region
MPTIDQLQAATASADTDELITSQGGVSVKVTRSQLLAGLQPSIAVPPGALLGNSGSTVNGPQSITVGSNLTLANNTLSGTAFSIAGLPLGRSPIAADLISLSQSGTAAAITYGTFLNGIASLPNLAVEPTAATATRTLPAIFGDSLTIEDFGAVGDGTTDDTAAFLAAAAAGAPVRLGPKTYAISGPTTLVGSAVTLIGVAGKTTLHRLSQSSGSIWITIAATLFAGEGLIFDANSAITSSTIGVNVSASCLRAVFQHCGFTNTVSGTGLQFSTSDPALTRHNVTACEAFGNVRGISCTAADGVIVSGCHLHDNTSGGITVDNIDSTHTIKTRTTQILGNQCWNNLVGIQVGDYSLSNVVPTTATNTNPDVVQCLIASNTCHDNSEYGIAAQGYNVLVQGNLVYNNGGTNLGNGGILANVSNSAVRGNLISLHLGYAIDAGASIFTDIGDNFVTTARIGINAGGSQGVRVAGNYVENCSGTGITIFHTETDANGNTIGVPTTNLVIAENHIDIPTGASGIVLQDGPQLVSVLRNTIVTVADADVSLCLLPFTDSVTIQGNLLNGSPTLHLYDPFAPSSGPFSGFTTLAYPDVLDSVSIAATSAAVQSICALSALNYAQFVTFVRVTSGGSGYASAPTVTFSGGGGSGATAAAVVSGGVLIGFRMGSLGSGYTTAPTISLSGGGGSGGAATAFIGVPVPTGRNLRVYCGVAVSWAVSGSRPSQTTASGTAITTPANSDIDWVGRGGGWYAARHQQTDYVAPSANGSVTFASISGDLRLHPGGSGAVRWVSDAQATGCTTTVGAGTPNGVVSAPPGSDYRNLTGASGSVFWIKQSGTGSSGWLAVA